MVVYKYSKGKYYLETLCHMCHKKVKTAPIYFDDGDVHNIKEFEWELRDNGWKIGQEVILSNGNKDWVEFCCEDCYNKYLEEFEKDSTAPIDGYNESCLSYTLSKNEKYYIVSGYDGSCSKVVIPENYNGLPVKDIDEKAFSLNKKIKEVVISKNITKIGKAIFKACINLEKVTFPEQLKSIGNYAFYNCSKLNNIIIPDSVKKIGKYAFNECASIENMQLPTVFEDDHNSFPHKSLKIKNCYYNGTINEWLKLELYCYSNLLSSVENLYFLDKDGDVEYNGRKYNLVSSVKIPEDITIITKNMFESLKCIESVFIPSWVEKIESYAFGFCSNLKNVIIDEGVKVIEDNVFQSCDSLQEIKIPNTVNKIGYSALPRNIKKVELGNKLVSVGKNLLYKTYLEHVYFNGSESEWNNYNFEINKNFYFKGVYVLDQYGEIEHNGKCYRKIEIKK